MRSRVRPFDFLINSIVVPNFFASLPKRIALRDRVVNLFRCRGRREQDLRIDVSECAQDLFRRVRAGRQRLEQGARIGQFAFALQGQRALQLVVRGISRAAGAWCRFGCGADGRGGAFFSAVDAGGAGFWPQPTSHNATSIMLTQDFICAGHAKPTPWKGNGAARLFQDI